MMMNTLSLVDYHMHTPLCGHAQGRPEEYARNAVAVGLKEIGFSDHMPLLAHQRDNISMAIDELPEYHRMIEAVRRQFAEQLDVKVGIEADFEPGYEAKTRNILTAYPYDYVIGSVHFLDDWGFDNPEEMTLWDQADVTAVYRKYYGLLRRSAASGLFNIMGHVDLVKKFGHRPAQNLEDEIQETARVFKDSGVAIEINTAGLRKPVQEMYPSLSALRIYCEAGVPVTFGSDAHLPGDVGRDFDKAVDWAKQAGYKEFVTFSGGKIRETRGL